MKIYFAGSIRGGRQFADVYAEVIKGLQAAGHTVLSEHVGFSELNEKLEDTEIHDRDLAWIDECDIVIADASQTSGGVGYEIAYAKHKANKPVFVFAHVSANVSAMYSRVDKKLYYNHAEHYLLSVLYVISELEDANEA